MIELKFRNHGESVQYVGQDVMNKPEIVELEKKFSIVGMICNEVNNYFIFG